MTPKLRTLILIFLIASVIFSTAFILVNSLMDYERSHSSSGVVTDIITSTEDEKEWASIELLVRKFAHVIEYALLGACVMALALFISRVFNKFLFGYSIAYSLFIAVLDEHFQSFSDRVSSTSDILLDFLGSIIGSSLVLIIFFVTIHLVRKNKKHKQKNAQSS